MGESDRSWGDLAEYDDDLAQVWDSYARLPEPGEHDALDGFCASKRIDIAALVRIGTRLASYGVLAFAYPGGIKYRDIEDGRRWTSAGAEFTRLKIVRCGASRADTVVVAEGETDAARLTMLYPSVDVAVMPAGAKRFPAGYAAQLLPYARVLVGTDNDEAGDVGAAKVGELVPQATRFAPPGNDWCELDGEPPAFPEAAAHALDTVIFGRELMELEVPEVASWFEHALLPIGGLLMLHGWAKSFKTFMALDLLSAIAQGQDWGGFEPTEEPSRVCAVQFEIPWPYYRARMGLLRKHAREPELWDENFGTWTPMMRPELRAGSKAQQDHMRGTLVEAGVQVVLIDPIRRAMGALDANSEQDVRKMLGFFESLQDEGITVVTTHHDGKAATRMGGGDPLSMTGSGAFAGDPDTLVSISLPYGVKDTNDPRRNLHFTLRNAPAIGARGMEISSDGKITYATTPYGKTADGDGEPGL